MPVGRLNRLNSPPPPGRLSCILSFCGAKYPMELYPNNSLIPDIECLS